MTRRALHHLAQSLLDLTTACEGLHAWGLAWMLQAATRQRPPWRRAVSRALGSRVGGTQDGPGRAIGRRRDGGHGRDGRDVLSDAARALIRTSPFCSGLLSRSDSKARPVARSGLRRTCGQGMPRRSLRRGSRVPATAPCQVRAAVAGTRGPEDPWRACLPRVHRVATLTQILHKSCILLMTCHAPVWHTPFTWDAGRPHCVPQLCSDASRPRRMQGCSSPWQQAVMWVAGNLRHGA
jgi:hypothetical protein